MLNDAEGSLDFPGGPSVITRCFKAERGRRGESEGVESTAGPRIMFLSKSLHHNVADAVVREGRRQRDITSPALKVWKGHRESRNASSVLALENR